MYNNPKQPLPSKKKLSDNAYLRYTGLGLQVAATVAVCIVIGHYMDRVAHFKMPYITLLFSIIGIFAAVYLIIKEVSK